MVRYNSIIGFVLAAIFVGFKNVHVDGKPAAACARTYTVQPEDYDAVHVVESPDACDVIASQADITTAVLLANNPNIDNGCINIHPGQVLCVAPANA